MSEPVFLDATGGEPPEEVAGYITNQIVIRRILTDEGQDRVFVDWPDDASLLELLGMIEYARTMIWEYYGDDDRVDEEDDE